MVDDAARPQVAQKIADLVDGDRVAGAGVHPAALRDRNAAVDADQFSGPVEERPPRIARVDRRVDLQAIGVFEDRVGRILVAVHAAHDPVGRGRLKVGREQKGISEDVDPVPGADRIAVAPRRRREIVASDELDQGDVAGRIDADQHRVIQLAVAEAALEELVLAGDVKIGQGIAVARDQHAGPAAGGRSLKDGHDRGGQPGNCRDAGPLGIADRGIDPVGPRDHRGQTGRDGEQERSDGPQHDAPDDSPRRLFAVAC